MKHARTACASVIGIVACVVLLTLGMSGAEVGNAAAPRPTTTVTTTRTVTATATATVTATQTVTATATVTATQTVPGPTTTVTEPGPTVTTTVPGPTTTTTVTATPTPTGNPAPLKIVGMSAPPTLWSQRLAEVGRCGVEARRVYATMSSNGTAQSSQIQTAISDGMMPVVSYKVPDVTTAGTGGYNSWANATAAFLDGLGVPIVVTVWHEPNGDMTGAQFAAMHRQMDPYFKRGLLKVGPIFNGFPLDTPSGQADLDTYAPADLMNLWDYFGIDTYNATSDDRIGYMEQYVADRGHPDVPLVVGEYNATNAQDLTDAGNAMLASPTMWAFLLWNSGDGTGGAAATPVTGDRLTAFQATKADARVLHETGC